MTGWLLAVARRAVVLAVAAAVVVGLPATAAPADDSVPRPVLNVDFPDPAVLDGPGGLVAYSTGARVPHAWARTPRGRWTPAGAVLTKHPSWARAGGIWAVDVVEVGRRWVLYYAVPVRGLGEHGRCIGAARATSPRGPFAPVGSAPLVCPSYAPVPTASDPMLPRDRSLPRAGVIDPSAFVDADGSRYLLYKTDRVPSSIRLLPLDGNGTRARRGASSIELLRHDGVLENPVLVRRAEGYVLLLSEGDWTRCGYRTVWRRTTTLTDWSQAGEGVLLDRTSGLCGPGGADVVGERGDRVMFLHGWTCHGAERPCEGGAKWDKRRRARGKRALYAANLRWPGGVPMVAGWLSPR